MQINSNQLMLLQQQGRLNDSLKSYLTHLLLKMMHTSRRIMTNLVWVVVGGRHAFNDLVNKCFHCSIVSSGQRIFTLWLVS